LIPAIVFVIVDDGMDVDDAAGIDGVVASVGGVVLKRSDDAVSHAPNVAASKTNPAIDTLDMMRSTLAPISSS